MEILFVGSDVIVEIYRFALQLLAYILGSAALIAFVGGLFCMAQVFRPRETGSGLLRAGSPSGPVPSAAYTASEPRRHLYLVRTQM